MPSPLIGGLTYPPPNMLTVYADGIVSIAQTYEVVKVYLAKNDNPVDGEGDAKPATVAQVIFPMSVFVNTFAFFETTIKRYIKDGLVRQEDLDRIRQAYREAFGDNL